MDAELASVLGSISKNPSIRTLILTRSLTGMKLKHIPPVMDALVNMIQKDDFLLQELVLSENKLKNDIHDFINALGSNQSLLKLGRFYTIYGNYILYNIKKNCFMHRHKRQLHGRCWSTSAGQSIANQ